MSGLLLSRRVPSLTRRVHMPRPAAAPSCVCGEASDAFVSYQLSRPDFASAQWFSSAVRNNDDINNTNLALKSIREQNFEQWIERLIRYKEHVGDLSTITRANCSDSNLVNWVGNIRHQYSQYKEGRQSILNPERIERLEEIGFPWSVHEQKWEERFEQYCKFLEENPDKTLPKQMPNPLLHWENRQRMVFKKGGELDGKVLSNTMKERKEKLESVGFVFNCREEVFQHNFQMLREFYIQHGNCIVTFDVPVLGKFVDRMRQQFKKGELSSERIELLNSIGFEWNVLEAKWEANYQDFVTFFNDNGHCGVPADYKPNKKLGRWARYQRELFAKHMKGGKTTLSETRIAKLLSVGFLNRR